MMRVTIVVLMLASSRLAAAAGDDTLLCEKTWPRQPHPSDADSRRCGQYWLETYAGGTESDDDILWDLTATDLERLADEVEAACGDACRRHSRPAPLLQAAELLRDVARSHFDLVDRASHRSIVPVLGKLLRGERIDTVEALHWSSVTLARFIGAPYARHGRRFDAPDLMRFYYGDRGPGTGATDLLPRKLNPSYSDAQLDAADHVNLALLGRAQGGALTADRSLQPRFCRRFCRPTDFGEAGPCGQCGKEDFEDDEARVTRCEKVWPAPATPERDVDAECADYYERRYIDSAGKPKLGTDLVWRLSSRQLRGMAQRLRDGGLAADFPRAVAFFEAAAAAHFDLVDPRTHISFEPTLAMILAGRKVPPEMLRPLAPVTLGRLREAPAARHGKIFADEDLQRFYYGKGTTPSKLLPLTANAKYTDALLDDADRANIAAADSR